jgi:hypothetical protein
MSNETVFRTPHVNCPACIEKRLHTEAETAAYHPYSGHGYTKETGWSHPDLP